jgi:hypothetical protein
MSRALLLHVFAVGCLRPKVPSADAGSVIPVLSIAKATTTAAKHPRSPGPGADYGRQGAADRRTWKTGCRVAWLATEVLSGCRTRSPIQTRVGVPGRPPREPMALDGLVRGEESLMLVGAPPTPQPGLCVASRPGNGGHDPSCTTTQVGLVPKALAGRISVAGRPL